MFRDGGLQSLEGPEFALVSAEHLALHGAEERFHYAVVDAVALSGHRLGDPLFPEPFAALPHLVLPALAAVEDRALRVRTLRERLVEHPRRLLGIGR